MERHLIYQDDLKLISIALHLNDKPLPDFKEYLAAIL